MDIQDLRIFARVAALQNLSAVGSELGLTPGTISKRVQHLEDVLKVRLFDRTTRSIRLTDEGRTFLEHAERIVAEMDLARDAVGATSSRPSGRLKVSAPASLSDLLVAPAIATFVEAYPDIEIRIDITDRIANLQEEGYDVAIRAGTLPDCALKAKRLISDSVILVASPDYVRRCGAPQRPADLAVHACLLLGDQRSWTLIRGREQETVRVGGRLQSDSGAFLHRAALAAAGILRTSRLAVADDLAKGRLLHVMADHELAENAAIWALYPNTRHTMPRLRVFLDHLADYCRSPALDLQSVLTGEKGNKGTETDEAA